MTLAISSGKDSANIKPSHKDQERKTHIHIMADAPGPMSPSVKAWVKTPDEINSIIANAGIIPSGGGQTTATPAATSG
ncbi:hypothetical protein CEP54_004487 [Fusarium duplospermum]|uniref:Uncharacterized protein n=1 Tax=Fusarium duplospermum TaxID=1325734 RepID=A0A428QI20_9HYPO|nr:hypothetical protein CEP54_004487 [Fusarium duplospermum]